VLKLHSAVFLNTLVDVKMFCKYGYWFSVNSTEIQVKGSFLLHHLRKNIDYYEMGADQSIISPSLGYRFVKDSSWRGIQVTYRSLFLVAPTWSIGHP
jgi:hypothetical protein